MKTNSKSKKYWMIKLKKITKKEKESHCSYDQWRKWVDTLTLSEIGSN
jgi:hypothetical protein